MQVDAFTAKPFGGNPAAILLQSPSQAEATTDDWRQKFANEMNLSETSFVELPEDDPNGSWASSRYCFLVDKYRIAIRDLPKYLNPTQKF